MIITYFGKQFFKIQHGDVSVLVNPAESLKSKGRFNNGIVLSSIHHSDFISEDILKKESEEDGAFVISRPGEYEVKGVVIRGFLTKTSYSGKKHNTIYLISLDNIKVCILGAISDVKDIDTETLALLSGVDILITPIGGDDVLSAEEAYKFAVKMAPKVIIPAQYDKQETLKRFFNEGGEDKVALNEKFVAKRKDLDQKSGEIIALSS